MIRPLMLGAETVGREEELASIARFLNATALPGVLVLEGEAGIGKTTLWHEGVRIARKRSWHVLISRPARSEVRLAFAGLVDLLASAVQPVLPELPAPQRRALEAALLLREESAPPDPRTIAVAFLSVLRALVRQRPLLLAVDDVQWLDEPSARVLAFALRRLEGERLAALFTQRVGERSDAPHAELADALRDGRVETLRIGPLSLGAMHVLLRDRLELTLARPALQQVHAASAGNPFLALEIARAIQRRGGHLDPREPLPVPTGVDELIGERLATLPDVTLQVLLVAAAQREPTLAACTAALRDVDVSARLRPALLAHVVELEGDRLRFTHPLLAAAVYSRADAVRRRAVHRRLAETAPTLEERARHLALATEAPDERVASALEVAAASAAGRGAPDASAALLEIAVALTPADRADDKPRRMLMAARQHFLAGEVARMREIVERLIGELPASSLRGAAALSLAWATEDWKIVRRLCQQAIDEAVDDPASAAAGHYYLSFVSLVTGDIEDARTHGRVALELAERGGEEGLVAMYLAGVIFLDTLAGERVGEDLVACALALEERNPEMSTHYPPSLTCGLRAMYADRLDEARRLFALAERRVVERGDEYMLGGVRLHQAELEDRSGNWELAARYAEEGLQITERLTFESRQSPLLYVTARVAAHNGRVEKARGAAARGHELTTRDNDNIFGIQCLAVLGFLELSRGDAAAADRYLRPLPERLAAGGFGEPSLCPALPDAIEALVLVGEHDLARGFTDRLEEQARKVKSVWARALAARCRGLIASGAGAFDDAIVHFRRSLDEELPEPFERGRTLLALGTTLRRAKQRRQSRSTLEEALAVFDRLGAPLWAAKARVELARIGGRVAHQALTATERQVAELVARGLSNKEVAAALVVSERAVEANLTHIYEKFGIRSRTELVRRVVAEERGQPRT